MKKVYNKKRFSFAAIALLSLSVAVSVLMYACKKPTEGINVLVDSQALSPAPTLVSFMNADSTSLNQPGDFPVTITGPGAASVQMVSGGTTFTASHGLLPLSLVKGSSPSLANPVIFTVTAKVAGFAPFVQTIVITDSSPGLYEVKALDYSTSAAGTTFINKTITASAGTTSGVQTISTATTSTLSETSTITIPSGTVFKDANNTTINASSFSASVIQVGSTTAAAFDAFPGGEYSSNVLDQNGNPIAGGANFVPVGGLSISLVAGSTPVKSFSTPISGTVEINSGVTNFETGAAMKVGDIIPYFSLNEATGQWKYEGNATVFLDGNNKLAATMNITHLSYWACAFFWTDNVVVGAKYAKCGGSLTVNIATDDAAFKGQKFTVYLETPAGVIIAKRKGGDIHNGSSVTFKNVPAIPQAKVALYYKGKVAAVGPVFNTCSAGTVSLTLPTGPIKLANPVNISVTVNGKCTTKDVIILPSGQFSISQQIGTTSSFQSVGFLNIVNGYATTTLDAGVTYNIGTYYAGNYYQSGNFVVAKSAITIPTGLGAFTLTSTYNADSNTIFIKGTIPIDCK